MPGRGWLASSSRGFGLLCYIQKLTTHTCSMSTYWNRILYFLLIFFFFCRRMCQWLRGSVVVVVVVVVSAVIGRRKTMGILYSHTHTHTHTLVHSDTSCTYALRGGDPFRMHRNARRSFRPRAPPKRTWSKLANTIESPFCI